MAEKIPDLALATPGSSLSGDGGSGIGDGEAAPELWVETTHPKTGSGLTEVEIFGLLSQNLRSVADKCKTLAWHPRRGHIYLAFIKECDQIEGCCRQAAAHREDARWLVIGRQIAIAKGRVGFWVRGMPSRDARKVAHKLLLKLAESLEKMAYDCEQLKTAATGHVGMILPKTPAGPHRDTKPVAVMLPSGLIVPTGHA